MIPFASVSFGLVINDKFIDESMVDIWKTTIYTCLMVDDLNNLKPPTNSFPWWWRVTVGGGAEVCGGWSSDSHRQL